MSDQNPHNNPEQQAAAEPYSVRRLIKDIRDSIRGNEHDFTSGSIGRAILLLSVPMVLEMAMESVFAVVDIFFVARLGPEAVATVGLTESMLTLIYAVAMGMSMATTAIIARRIGENNRRGASVAAIQAIGVGILVSVPVAILGFFYSAELLILMGASDTIVAELTAYTTIMLTGNAVIMLLFIINAIFRGAGDAAISMRVLWFANILNMILDPLLIFGIGPFPELGITGAAIATTTGRGFGVIYQFRILSRPGNRIRIRKVDLRLNMEVAKRLIRLSMGGIGQFLIATASWVGLTRIMAEFGSEALAGYTIAIRIIIFSLLPSWGMSNAAATLVGQNLGAGKADRAERSVYITAVINMVVLMLIGLLFFIYAEELVMIFTDEPSVIRTGAQCLRIICYGYLFYSWGMITVQAFNGAGDTTTPTILNLICFWMVEIPLAWALSMSLGFGSTGIFLSIVIGESLLGILGVVLFRRGKWKLREV